MQTVKISKGTSRDIINCCLMAEKLTEYFTANAINKIRTDLQNHKFFVAKGKSKIRGFISFVIKNPHVSEISWLAVEKKYLRKGIGTSLLKHMIKVLKKKKVKIVKVNTLSSKARYEPYEITRSFYEKMRFVLIDTIDPYPGWDQGNPCDIYVHIIK